MTASGRPVGRAILALFCALVGLLGLFASGSYYLIGAIRGELADWVQPATGMLLTALAYMVLAGGLWTGSRAVRWMAPLLLTLLAAYAMFDTLANEVLDLAAALLFFLAAVAAMAVIAWSRFFDRPS